MILFQRFREIIKSVFIVTASIISFTSIFVLAYTAYDYQIYLQKYKEFQISELNAVEEKINSTIISLKKLMELASIRIQAANGNQDRIAIILNSLHSLNSLNHLNESRGTIDFQKVTYTQLLPNQIVISRFGRTNLEENLAPYSLKDIEKNGFTYVIQDGKLNAFMPIKKGKNSNDSNGSIDGILNIQINNEAYLKFLGSCKTISFVPESSQKPIITKPLPIYEKIPQSFTSYAIERSSHFAIFALFAIFLLMFMMVYLNRANKKVKTIHQEYITTLENNLAELTTSRTNLSLSLTKLQEDTKAHHTACKSRKELAFKVNIRRKLQEQELKDTLGRALIEIKNPRNEISIHDVENIFSHCFDESSGILNEQWAKDPEIYELYLDEIIESVQKLFADRIQSNKVQVIVDFPEEDNEPFDGDPLLMELIFMNIIGRAIYSVSAESSVEIIVRKQDNYLEMTIKHGGYLLSEIIENKLKKNFELFANNATFQHMCMECHIICSHTKVSSGNNEIHLKIPLEAPLNQEQEETKHGEGSNVVPLFSK